MNRLNQMPTLRVHPEKKVTFRYGKKTIRGMEGDTIATALYAAGVRIFSRSLKYHRPRGLYSLDGECSNTMMKVDGMPNVSAEKTFIRNGMVVEPQNCLGSPEWDFMSFMDKMSWAMPAGFYYRVFHRPARLWPHVIKPIRNAAGQGALSPDFEMKGRFDEIFPRADVCVIGGGAAGMSAALAAAEQGLRVILLEARPWLGGCWEYRALPYDGDVPLYEKARELARRVEEHGGIRVLKHTAVMGTYPGNVVTGFQKGGASDSFDERYIEIRAESVVVATGCIERPLLFDNNERPGVMQAGCAQRLARTWGLLPGKKAVFSVGHDLGLETALDLFDLGVEIACIADHRMDGQSPALLSKLAGRKIPLLKGWVAARAHGRKGVTGVTLTTHNGIRRREYPCDLLVASAGLTPVSGPLSLAGAKLAYDGATGFFLPVSFPEKMHAAGRLLGLSEGKSLEMSGRIAGLRAAMDCGKNTASELEDVQKKQAATTVPSHSCKHVMAPVKGRKTFICFDEDTTVKNVDQAMKTGFDVPELIKRWTAAGTGPGQGGIPGHNLPLYVAQTGDSPDRDPRPTTVRPPLVPTLIATYAGSNHDMSKRTPMHDAQVAAGGRMERIGVWNRARRFSDDLTVRDEILNVRNNVGMLDSSTLGKFRLFGPDALKALQRVYVGDMSKTVEGRVKYSAMCNEDGCVIDDGVVIKRGENEYYLTSSTVRAGATAEWFHYHTRYEKWDYHIVNLTDAFGVINLAGPNSRKVLEKVTDADVSNEGFPFMGYREFFIEGEIPVRAMRLGFVGELSYEFHVPSSYMQALWDVLEEAGQPFGIKNFGLEAQNVLRLEKAHVILGAESEQRTTLHDIGLGFLWARKKPECQTVGVAALRHTEHQKGRLKLVGFQMADGSARPPKDGSIIVDSRIRGYVCTARYCPAQEKTVGLALVEDSLTEMGTRLGIYEDGCEGKLLHGEVIPTPFYDPEGTRMKM